MKIMARNPRGRPRTLMVAGSAMIPAPMMVVARLKTELPRPAPRGARSEEEDDDEEEGAFEETDPGSKGNLSSSFAFAAVPGEERLRS